MSLILGIAIQAAAFAARAVDKWQPQTGSKFVIGILIHAHLVAVLFRSHGNAAIRRLHPVRFFAVPVGLFFPDPPVGLVALSATVVAVWWDVWHPARRPLALAVSTIANRGNPSDVGRRLDYWLNQVLYPPGPILGGVTLIDHLAQLDGYRELGSQLFVAVPVYAVAWRGRLALDLCDRRELSSDLLRDQLLPPAPPGLSRLAAQDLPVCDDGACSDLHVGLQQLGRSVLHHEPVPRRAVPGAGLGY